MNPENKRVRPFLRPIMTRLYKLPTRQLKAVKNLLKSQGVRFELKSRKKKQCKIRIAINPLLKSNMECLYEFIGIVND